MGGYGSGRRYGKGTTSDMRSIDVRYMHRKGLLKIGMSGSLSWSRNGQQVASINFRVEGDALRLMYRSRRTGEGWKDHDYVVHLTYTPCNYGGRRAWFLCPCCGWRAAVLYGGSIYACRKCHQLAYKSQRETPGDRAINRAEKIRERLKWTPGILNGPEWKPKGMHWRTFEWLQREHDQACSFGCSQMMERLDRMNERVDKIKAR